MRSRSSCEPQRLKETRTTALRRFLAEKLSIPQRAIVLEHGERSRDKVIRIDGLSEKEVGSRLLATI